MCYDLPIDLGDNNSGIIEALDIIDANLSTTNLEKNAFLNQLKANGKILLSRLNWKDLTNAPNSNDKPGCGVDLSNENSDITTDFETCVNLTLASMEKIINDNNNQEYFHGFALDEYVTSHPIFFTAVSEAIGQFKKLHPKSLAVVWGSRLAPDDPKISDQDKLAVGSLMEAADYYVPEIYNSDNNVKYEEGPNDYRLYLTGLFNNWQSIYSGITNKTIVGLSSSDVAHLDYDLNPQVDFYENLDRQFKLVKEKISSGTADGIAIFDCAGTNFESNNWIANLFNHYKIASNDYLGGPRDLEFIQNGGFEEGNTNWSLTPGADGIIENKEASSLGITAFGHKDTKKIPQADSSTDSPNVMLFVRGGSTNVIKQDINNLEIGKKYKLTVYSKRISDEYIASDVGIKIIVRDTQLEIPEARVSRERHTYYPVAPIFSYGEHADISLETCQAKYADCNNFQHLWTKDEVTFEAPADNLALKIHDYNALRNAQNIVDFVQLQPSHLPICGNNKCEAGEFGNCPQDCAEATLTLSADKEISTPGEVITYQATFTNRSQVELRNSFLYADVPQGTTYIEGSATGSGSLDASPRGDPIIVWNKSTLLVGEEYQVSYQVRVN